MKIEVREIKRSEVNEAAHLLAEGKWHNVKEARKEVSGRIKKHEVFVGLYNDKVVGLFIYARDYSHYANMLDYIVVSKKHRGLGISQSLLSAYISISRKETLKKQIYALSSTNAHNKVSMKMHAKLGFKKIGVLKKLHYGVDEIFFGYNLRGKR